MALIPEFQFTIRMIPGMTFRDVANELERAASSLKHPSTSVHDQRNLTYDKHTVGRWVFHPARADDSTTYFTCDSEGCRAFDTGATIFHNPESKWSMRAGKLYCADHGTYHSEGTP